MEGRMRRRPLREPGGRPERPATVPRRRDRCRRASGGASRKREVALRLLRGESLEVLSRELSVEVYRLEEWRERALAGLDAALRERPADDPLQGELGKAMKRIGELSMEVELLRERCQAKRPLPPGRPRR